MRGFVALHVRPLRNHPLRFVLSLGGVAVGVALMVMMLGLFSSLVGAAEELSALSSGADIEVSAPNDGGLAPELEAEIEAVPGVAALAPLLRSNVVVDGETVLLLGIDQRLGEVAKGFNLRGCLPQRLRGDEGLLLGPALRDRTSMQLTSPNGSERVNVLGRIDCDAAHSLNAGRFVAGPLAASEALLGRALRHDSIAIKAAKGTTVAALTEAVDKVVDGRGIVGTPALAAEQATKSIKSLQQGSSVTVALALVVGGFCVFNTMSMTALERRRELATLRAIGGTRRSLLRGFLLEMTITGLLGSALGIALGAVAGKQLTAQVPAVIVDTVGVRPTFSVAGSIIVVALVLGTLTTLGAAFFPARGAVSVEPVEAMRSEGPAESATIEFRSSLRALVIGAVVFFGGIALALSELSGNATMAGFGVIIVGSLIAQYGARGPIALLTARVAERFGNSGRLAAASIARAPRRTWATVTAVTVAVITVVAIGGIIENQGSSIVVPFRSMADSDVWVATAPPEDLPVTIRLGRETVDTLKAVPGVADVFGGQNAYTTVGDERALVEAVDRNSNAPVFGALRGENLARIVDDTKSPVAAITLALANQQGLKTGDTLTLTTPSGRLRLPIIAVVDVVAPTQSGVVAVSLKTLEQAYGREGYTFLELMAKPGVSREALTERVAAVMKDVPTPTFVFSGDEAYRGSKRSVEQSLQLISAMEYAVLLGTALALGNALLISVVERRREIGIIRAIGTTRGQLRNMILFESVALGLTGLLLGIAQGLLQHRIGIDAVESVINQKVQYVFTFVPAVQVTIAIVAISLVAALLPAARAARTNLIETIGYE